MNARRCRTGIFFFLFLFFIMLSACGGPDMYPGEPFTDTDAAYIDGQATPAEERTSDICLPDGSTVPGWDGAAAYIEANGNEPYFDAADRSRTDAFEEYSDLDALGRCGPAYANICTDLMPTEKRGEIGNVRPSGWHTVRYNGVVPGNYLYNRCHLIGYQLAGENANEKNLITGTRYLNIEGMLGFENLVADYVKGTGNHVLYRVTPVYSGDEPVARGVLMEGFSVEDGGEGVRFNVFAYNVQPGVDIDYPTGDSRLSDGREVMDGVPVGEQADGAVMTDGRFVANEKTGKFHLEDCEYADSMNPDNRAEFTCPVQEMLDAGYEPCGKCHPDEAA